MATAEAGSSRLNQSGADDIEIDSKLVEMFEAEQQFLFSISMYTPPKAARVATGGAGEVGEEARDDGNIIGGRLAIEQQEQLSLDERHQRVCRFVSVVHRYMPNAKFLVHVEVDVPERLMREVLRASGWRTRFIVYEIVAKLFDTPIKPGVAPAPTGRSPAVAAAANLRLRQAAEAKLAAKRERRSAEGGEDDDEIDLETARALIAAEVPLMEMSHPHVRGSVIAGELIGATFAKSFGRDGMWEGTVTKFLPAKNARPSTSSYHKASGRATTAHAGVAAATAKSKHPFATGRKPGSSSASSSSASAPALPAAPAAAAPAPAETPLVGRKRLRIQVDSYSPPLPSPTAVSPAPAVTAGGSSAKGKGRGRPAGIVKSPPPDEGAGVEAEKVAPGMDVQVAPERAKKQKLAPVAAAEEGTAAAGAAGNVSSSAEGAGEERGRGTAATAGAGSAASPAGGSGRGQKLGQSLLAARMPVKARQLRLSDKTLILRHAFWDDIWPHLEADGWEMHHVLQGKRHARYYFPPGVVRGRGSRLRIDFFDSIKHAIEYMRQMPRWIPLMEATLKKHKGSDGSYLVPYSPVTPPAPKSPHTHTSSGRGNGKIKPVGNKPLCQGKRTGNTVGRPAAAGASKKKAKSPGNRPLKAKDKLTGKAPGKPSPSKTPVKAPASASGGSSSSSRACPSAAATVSAVPAPAAAPGVMASPPGRRLPRMRSLSPAVTTPPPPSPTTPASGGRASRQASSAEARGGGGSDPTGERGGEGVSQRHSNAGREKKNPEKVAAASGDVQREEQPAVPPTPTPAGAGRSRRGRAERRGRAVNAATGAASEPNENEGAKNDEPAPGSHDKAQDGTSAASSGLKGGETQEERAVGGVVTLRTKPVEGAAAMEEAAGNGNGRSGSTRPASGVEVGGSRSTRRRPEGVISWGSPASSRRRPRQRALSSPPPPSQAPAATAATREVGSSVSDPLPSASGVLEEAAGTVASEGDGSGPQHQGASPAGDDAVAKWDEPKGGQEREEKAAAREETEVGEGGGGGAAERAPKRNESSARPPESPGDGASDTLAVARAKSSLETGPGFADIATEAEAGEGAQPMQEDEKGGEGVGRQGGLSVPPGIVDSDQSSCLPVRNASLPEAEAAMGTEEGRQGAGGPCGREPVVTGNGCHQGVKQQSGDGGDEAMDIEPAGEDTGADVGGVRRGENAAVGNGGSTGDELFAAAAAAGGSSLAEGDGAGSDMDTAGDERRYLGMGMLEEDGEETETADEGEEGEEEDYEDEEERGPGPGPASQEGREGGAGGSTLSQAQPEDEHSSTAAVAPSDNSAPGLAGTVDREPSASIVAQAPQVEGAGASGGGDSASVAATSSPAWGVDAVDTDGNKQKQHCLEAAAATTCGEGDLPGAEAAAAETAVESEDAPRLSAGSDGGDDAHSPTGTPEVQESTTAGEQQPLANHDQRPAAAGTGAESAATARPRPSAAAAALLPSRKSGRRRIESDRVRDAKADAIFIKKQRLVSHGGGGSSKDAGNKAQDSGESSVAAESTAALVAAGLGGGPAGMVQIDPTVVAKPTDLFMCRFKEGYEENISVARLKQLGASFTFTRAGIAATPVTTTATSDAGNGSDGLDNPGPGGGRMFHGPAKPGAQRILDAMCMSTLWNHKVRDAKKQETVVTASIHDDAELLVHEVLRLLKAMKDQDRDIGVSFWESPERKCLNECTLPLPASVEAQLAEEDAAIAAARATGPTKARVWCGKLGWQKIDTGGVPADWPTIPGGWAEPRHCHSGPLVIWKQGPARTRARIKGEFLDHCSAAMLGSGHFPPGAELMLMDGFLHGTGVLEKHAVFQRYKRRPWPQLSPQEAANVLGPANLPLPPGSSTRLQWKKKFVQVGKVPRTQEAIYVCSSRQALAAATCGKEGPAVAAAAAAAACQDCAAIGTAPWTAALETANNNDTTTPPTPSAATPTPSSGSSPAATRAGPHFKACIVCQRPETSSAGAAAEDGAAPLSLYQTRGPVGPLLLCSTCPASFHLSCLRPRLRVIPECAIVDGVSGSGGSKGSVKWSCAYCHAMGRVVGGDSDGACGAVRLMESLRQGMQGAVRVNALRTLRYNALG